MRTPSNPSQLRTYQALGSGGYHLERRRNPERMERRRGGTRAERYDTTPHNLSPLTPQSSETGHAAAEPRPYWRESLTLIEQHIAYSRRKVKAGDRVYLCGESFDTLFLVNSGLFKVVNLAPDGREQSAGLYFKGDWLGFDGIPSGRHGCSAVALDSGEVWTVRYEALLRTSVAVPSLMRVVMAAMSDQLARNRDAMLSIGTLTADARVADFLLQWAQSLAERGHRIDQINVKMTRADMGAHLGLTLESVSRALSKLSHCDLIQFKEKGRREISIPSLPALRAFIQDSVDRATPILH